MLFLFIGKLIQVTEVIRLKEETDEFHYPMTEIYKEWETGITSRVNVIPQQSILQVFRQHC